MLPPAESVNPRSVTRRFSGIVLLGSGLEDSVGPPDWVTDNRPIWFQTAVMMRKLMVTAIRSMKGTKLIAVSSGFLPPLPPAPRSMPPAMERSFLASSVRPTAG